MYTTHKFFLLLWYYLPVVFLQGDMIKYLLLMLPLLSKYSEVLSQNREIGHGLLLC